MKKSFVFDGEKGKFLDFKDAGVPLNDLIVQRGFGIKEDLRTYNSKPFGLDKHLSRLQNSAKIVGIKNLPKPERIKQIFKQGIKKAGGETYMKLIVTGGSGWAITSDSKPRWYVVFSDLENYKFPRKYKTGISLMTYEFEREFAKAKTANYFTALVAQREAKDKGYDEVLYITKKGEVLEGTTYTIAAVFGKTIVSPGEKVLDGVTMGVTLKLASDMGYKVKRQKLGLKKLLSANEVFVTSTTREVTPVIKVDRRRIGDGKIGEVTKNLRNSFSYYTKNY